jgi:cell division septation protein DedD
MDMAAKTAPVEPTATNAPLRASATVKTVVTVAPAAVPVTVPVSNNRYVIQVASYLGKKNAQMVADALKKKGYPAAVASKGTYHIVLVGAFTDKPSAMAMLAKLQKKYDGCFIRRQ